MARKNKKWLSWRKWSSRSRLGPILVLILILAGGAYAWHRHSNLTSTTTAQAPNHSAVTSTPSTSASSASKSSSANTISQGGAVDKKGQSPTVTSNSSEWTSSASGLITLQQPINNSRLSSGDYLVGTAKVNPVYYRLVDDQVGVIAQGSLSVVGGKFSGVLGFKHTASSGVLDVYSYDKAGAEANEIQIKVTF